MAAATAVATMSPAVLVTSPASAAPVVGFQPGNIISDQVFFNSSTMSAAAVQSFLDGKVSRCVTGYTCLKAYAQATTQRPADAYCNGYAASARETAAQIIVKSAQSCGINPQVLLVMLQKEQGLVTATSPTQVRYDKAMGFACPDTAACNSAYFGLQNQIYSAALQFRRYERSGLYTAYAPGRTVTVRYHPNASCGGAPVFIENRATSNLYTYTPYQPNAAALAAGRGTGDACSAYGNRNFYTFFSEWFGSPSGIAVTGSLRDYWVANGGASGVVGVPTSPMTGTADGWFQRFTGADLFLRAGRTVAPVRGSIRTEYRGVGEIASGLGWPVGPEYSIVGGAYQDFEFGRIFAKSGIGTAAVAPPMVVPHEQLGNVGGVLGWPKGRAVPVGEGSRQEFDGGTIYARDDESVHVLTADLADLYRAQGGPAGLLGWPGSGVTPDRVGTHVVFDGGWIQKAGPSTWLVKGLIGAYYVSSGGIDGELGAVRGPEVWHPTGGWSQEFENGTVYASEAGTFAVTDARTAMSAAGGVAATGFPVEEVRRTGSSWSQRFGTVTFTGSSSGEVAGVRGAIRRHYDALGGASSFLGRATSGERPVGPGFVQDFEGGQIWCGTSALVAMDSRTAQHYARVGGPTGRLGWPVSSPTAEPGGARQEFQGGTVFTSSTPGGAVGHVWGGLRTVYVGLGGPRAVGFPTGDEQLVAGAWKQNFERGAAYLPLDGSPGSLVSGRIWEAYVAAGAEGDPRIGVPIAPSTTTASGATKQVFRSATFFTTPTGTHVVRGYLRTMFSQFGGEAGRLGLPLESERSVGVGHVQRFEGARLYVSPFGAAAVWGAIGAEHERRGGVQGSLGWPVGPEVAGPGRWSQKFQHGTLVLLADGRYLVE
ncbi:LGFP repeat protein [Aeromicrobium marinum DSM 15272]|uniref:LGFP repeat protein n=1 Tax=Aeromicrobium marinum DSM 15272 TaxID=585531 RepID=E2SG34_9ACTN|nr:LGFP repeat protein [Aeromicrobium marinum DSM 15272]